MRCLLITLCAFVLSAASAAASYPHYPAWWMREARCIHHFEVYGHEGRSDEWTVSGGGIGGYQFTYSTWASVGGRGSPASASPAEQTYRAWLVWKRDGGSWSEWSTRFACGLR